jgi:hypothetical protein
MADNSIVQGLFGIDPASYQMQQQSNQDAQALRFAQLDPMQQAQYGAFRGGQQLGTIGATLMGGKDPMLAKATELKQLASQFDTTNPAGLRQLANALVQAGYPEQAQMAIMSAQKMLESQATVTSKTRENLSTMGKLVQERDALIRANPQDPRIAEYNKVIAAEGSSKTPNISVDAKMFDFGAGRRDVFLKEVNPLITQGAAVNQGLTLIDQGTPFAQAAFENTVVTALGGDKQKSREEIKRLINTGDLPTRFKNSLGKFLEGKITEETKEDQKNVLEAIQGNLKRTYTAKRDTILKASAGIPELRGQEDFIAPPWEATVTGSGAARGKKAFTVGETYNDPDYGLLKVTKVDQYGNRLEVQDSKGNIGTPKQGQK